MWLLSRSESFIFDEERGFSGRTCVNGFVRLIMSGELSYLAQFCFLRSNILFCPYFAST